jgi:hypothetical protein
MRKALSAPEPLQIAARYRSRILPIQGARLPRPTQIIAVTSFDDLLRIADLKQEPILYFVRDSAHYYFVQAGDVIYRHRVADADDTTTALAGTQGENS